MSGLKTWETGVMFWAGEAPAQTLETLLDLGFRGGQMGVPGKLGLDTRLIQEWKKALEQAHFSVYTVFAAFEGESYADIPTVQRTVGFIPEVTREVRERRMMEVSDFAAQLGVASIATHVGFVPENTSHPDYLAVREMVRRVCDHAVSHQQTFALETGQERANTLLDFLLDVNRRNLGINFDPANMILYGTGDPIESLAVVGQHVVSVHCKDGDWPPTGVPGALGSERPLGQGSVDLKAFLAGLRKIGYKGALTIEREAHDKDERLRDLKEGKRLLEELKAVSV
jgi:sugar phosphate isomerase/epimerase